MNKIDRFLARVNRVAGPAHLPNLGFCETHPNKPRENGYVYLVVDGRQIGAHVLSLERHLGRKLRPGMCACHICDNTACLRATHLFEGTRAENNRDCAAKKRTALGDRNGSRLHPERLARGMRNGRHTKPDRTARGDANGRSKLTEADVLAIRQLRSIGYALLRIAVEYNVGKSTVFDIVQRRTWAHL